VQRYQCKTCTVTFTATTGTIFFRKRTPEHEILETLALLAEGSRISTLTRVKGFKEDTILQWLREAAAHIEQVEALLMAEFKVNRGQLDALWAYVGNKGEKKLS
jgi:transposase-like protein